MNRRPPYAKLLTERAARTRNTQWVLIGADAWQTARTWAQDCNRHRPFTICPPDADPCTFDWIQYRHAPPPVGLVRCGRVDGDQLRTLVQCLLQAGAPRVFDLFADASYRPSARSAA